MSQRCGAPLDISTELELCTNSAKLLSVALFSGERVRLGYYGTRDRFPVEDKKIFIFPVKYFLSYVIIQCTSDTDNYSKNKKINCGKTKIGYLY